MNTYQVCLYDCVHLIRKDFTVDPYGLQFYSGKLVYCENTPLGKSRSHSLNVLLATCFPLRYSLHNVFTVPSLQTLNIYLFSFPLGYKSSEEDSQQVLMLMLITFGESLKREGQWVNNLSLTTGSLALQSDV